MRLTDSQAKYVNERIQMRLGVFVTKDNQEISIRTYTCSCGHTEEYLLFGECPICLKPIKYKHIRYRRGTQSYFAYELGMSLQGVQRWFCIARDNINDKRLEQIAKVLDVKKEDIINA